MSRYVPPASTTGDFTIRGVTVVDPSGGSAAADRDVRFAAGRIASVTSGAPTRHEASDVDGRGRWLIPGLVDMHAHALNTPDDIDGAYALMLANGIVGFRQMSGSPALLASRRAGTLPEPSGAPALLATPGDLLTPLNASTPESVVRTVREQKDQGADFIKAALIGHDAFLAALAEGRRIGIAVVGHLPADVDPREASRLKMRSMEHLGPGPSIFAATSSRETAVRKAADEGRALPPLPKIKLPGMDRLIGRMIRGIVVNPATRTSDSDARALTLADASFDEAGARDLAELFVANDTWQCPTLIRIHTQSFPLTDAHARDPRRRFMAPDELKNWDRSAASFAKLPQDTRDALEKHWAAQLRLTKLFSDAGVPMLAGTDADGASGVIPGFALHDEFDLLAEAGLTSAAILRMATSEPARFLARDGEAGRIAPGFGADAVLLDADPLDDHRALRLIRGVVRDGSYWSSSELDRTLRAVEDAPGAR